MTHHSHEAIIRSGGTLRVVLAGAHPQVVRPRSVDFELVAQCSQRTSGGDGVAIEAQVAGTVVARDVGFKFPWFYNGDRFCFHNDQTILGNKNIIALEVSWRGPEVLCSWTGTTLVSKPTVASRESRTCEFTPAKSESSNPVNSLTIVAVALPSGFGLLTICVFAGCALEEGVSESSTASRMLATIT